MDYQPIIEVVAEVLKHSIPIGIIFGITEWIVTSFLNFAFPKRFTR